MNICNIYVTYVYIFLTLHNQVQYFNIYMFQYSVPSF